jgi:hypothetical protein
MWTDEHRTTYCQSGGGFPSNLTDAQWARLEALIPPAKPGGRPRRTYMRAALDTLFYLLRTGCVVTSTTTGEVSVEMANSLISPGPSSGVKVSQQSTLEHDPFTLKRILRGGGSWRTRRG